MEKDIQQRAETEAGDAEASASLPRTERGSLHSEALVVLRTMIIEGELEFGHRVPEGALCRKLGISRTPFREAMRILSSEGLVTLLPRRGAIVATPSAEEFRGLFIAIGAIEAACAQLACDHMTVAEVEKIRAQHAAMIQASDEGRRREYYLANQEIHMAIVAGAGNSFLTTLHHSLSLRVSRARYFVDTPSDAWRRSLDEHVAILNAIEARNGDRLGQLLMQHIRNSCDDFEKLYANPETRKSAAPTGRGKRGNAKREPDGSTLVS